MPKKKKQQKQSAIPFFGDIHSKFEDYEPKLAKMTVESFNGIKQDKKNITFKITLKRKKDLIFPIGVKFQELLFRRSIFQHSITGIKYSKDNGTISFNISSFDEYQFLFNLMKCIDEKKSLDKIENTLRNLIKTSKTWHAIAASLKHDVVESQSAPTPVTGSVPAKGHRRANST